MPSTWSPTNTEEWMRRMEARLVQTERRVNPTLAGTSSERDSYFGVPADADERVALAGREWYDTDVGLWFRYYADDLDPAPPGVRAVGANWYPINNGMLNAMVDKTVAQTVATTSATMVTWRSAADAGSVYDPFGIYNQATDSFTAPYSGLWQVRCKLRYNGVIGVTAVVHRDGSAYSRSRSSDTGGTGGNTCVQIDVPVYVAAGSALTVITAQASSTSMSYITTETTMQMLYLAPPPR